MTEDQGSILVVDDDDGVLRTISRVLSSEEYEVVLATNGQAGLAAFRGRPFDVLISDISMPVMGGIEFLRGVREVSADIPVILITGDPSIESAIDAVEHSAFQYLTKPFSAEELQEVAARAMTHSRMARMRQKAVEVARTLEHPDDSKLLAQFERAQSTVWLAYQPIIDRTWNIIGYEALLRCEDSELRDPLELLSAAAQVGRTEELLATIRSLAPQPIRSRPEMTLFMNIDPHQLGSPQLVSRDDPVAKIADQVVLELTERISLKEVPDLKATISDLKSIGYRLAVDDLGAGYSGLSAFAEIGPDFVKLDRSLVTQVGRHPDKQRVISGIAKLCRELDMLVVAEGVENAKEFEMLRDLGCDLYQGFFVGKPEPLS